MPTGTEPGMYQVKTLPSGKVTDCWSPSQMVVPWLSVEETTEVSGLPDKVPGYCKVLEDVYQI